MAPTNIIRALVHHDHALRHNATGTGNTTYAIVTAQVRHGRRDPPVVEGMPLRSRGVEIDRTPDERPTTRYHDYAHIRAASCKLLRKVMQCRS